MAAARQGRGNSSGGNANKLVTPPHPGTSKTAKTGLPAGAPHGASRAGVLSKPSVKDPIQVSRTSQTGKQGGRQGVMTAKLGPTPVGIHGPGGMHPAVKGAVSGKGASTPNGNPKGMGSGSPNTNRGR